MKTKHKIFATVTIGGQSKEKYLAAFKSKDIYISSYAQELIDTIEFQNKIESIDLVKLTVEEMGLPNWSTTEQIYTKAKGLGFELCPAESALSLRIENDTPEWILIGMEQITDSDGDPSVFILYRDGAELELYACDAKPSYEWDSDREWVFRLRKPLDSETLENFDSLTLSSLVPKILELEKSSEKLLKIKAILED